MARPKAKSELLDASMTQYAALIDLIDSMDVAEREVPLYFGPNFQGKESHWNRDKNMRDVVVHLYKWQYLLLDWVASNQAGNVKPFIPEPYNWRTYGEMNAEFWRDNQQTSFDEALESLSASHQQVTHLIQSFTDEELFEKAHFGWTGTSSLGSYCVSATVSHYDWAIKKIRKHIRASKSL